ncbi:MAG: S1C family serine protease [Candidatus Coprovivens sp.]
MNYNNQFDFNSFYNNNSVANESQKNKGSVQLVVIFVVTIVISMMFGAGGLFIVYKINPDFIKTTSSNVTKMEKEVTVTDNGIADAVEKIYDSVVVVKTYVRNQIYSTGTGFVYKKNNNQYYLLTNYHVIQDSEKVNVVFTDGSEVTVSVAGGDKYSDIAVLAYNSPKSIKVSEIGSSVDMRVGDTVFAIGAPLDSTVYSWSVTRGVLSGKDREVEVSVTNSYTTDWIMQVLQTDAAINSGNSGGPLCNSNGEVIGITNMKLITSGVEGMGFAIPIEDATTYADRIINGEDMSRPYLGVSMVDASVEAYARQFGISPTEGVLIGSVESGSPSSKAGLRAGDVIIKMGDSKVTSVASLRYELYKYKSGDVVNVTYLRNGRTYVTSLTLVSK